MIDLSERHEAEMVRQGGLHANGIERLHGKLEMAMRMDDEGLTLALAHKIRQHAEKIADLGAWALAGESSAEER